MKQIMFKNKITHELVVCEDVRNVYVIDHVEYLPVHRVNHAKVFLLRKDALVIVNKETA